MRLHLWHRLDALSHAWRLRAPWICRRYDLALTRQMMFTPHRLPACCHPHRRPA